MVLITLPLLFVEDAVDGVQLTCAVDIVCSLYNLIIRKILLVVDRPFLVSLAEDCDEDEYRPTD